MLRIKQIGTICFAISILISAPLFAIVSCDPSLNGDCPYCVNSNLQTYSGTSNLQANWSANTIQLHWYEDSDATTEMNVASVSQSCVYDGTLTPPATIPTKTGYTFKGWRVRQASNDCFESSVCGLNGNTVNGLTYDRDNSIYGYNSHDGQHTHNTSTYGLTSTGTWAVRDTNGGIIKGTASCNDTAVSDPEYSYCNNDTFKPGNTFNTSSSGRYCWCKMSSYTPSGGSACNVASPSWVVHYDGESASSCASRCAGYCTRNVMADSGFRRAVFGVQ